MLRSLRSRLIAAFLLPTLAFFTLAGGAGYLLSHDILEDELGKGLSAVAAATASQLPVERLLSLVPEDDLNATRTFRNLSRQLTEARDAAGARRVFAFDKDGRVRVDAGGGLPVGAEVPELARDRLELARVFGGERVASQVLFTGSDGRPYKTGYAPLWLDGQVVGAVGVEGSAAFFGPLRQLFRGFLALALCAAVALVGVALATAKGISAPLTRLMQSALRMGRGDLSTPVPAERVKELGVLAQELESMRRALEGRDRQLKMMLAGVAHEVRNPIGGIELFAGLLSEELAATPQAEAAAHVARIRREIDYLKRVVEDFLAFAREQRLSFAPAEAPALLSSVADLLSVDAQKKNVSLALSAQPATVAADVALVTAALVNLLKNAVQASPEGGQVLLEGALRGDRYEMAIQDAGGGIPAEMQERIFEPFFTTREKGTGLGLPLARKIAQAHGGELTLESAPGKTRFTLSLPLQPNEGGGQ